VKQYIEDPSPGAASHFLDVSYLGEKTVVAGLGSVSRQIFGRSKHLWMWDYKNIEKELAAAGFVGIRRAEFNDSEDRSALQRSRVFRTLGRPVGRGMFTSVTSPKARSGLQVSRDLHAFAQSLSFTG
jgi:hypothetical protein